MKTKQENELDITSEVLFFQWWFEILITVSLILSIVTFVSYAFQGNGFFQWILWKFGLGGENNFGAWWSGMLLFLGAIFAIDGCFIKSRSIHQRRGWLAIAFILLILSFDEIASLHEGISWVLYGAVGLAVLAFAIIELILGQTDRRAIVLILVSFGLFGTIAIQEHLQHSLTWDNQLVYGVRALLEEGTELVAMLILISVTRVNVSSLMRESSPNALNFIVSFRKPLIVSGMVLAPVLASATFIMPFPGGPADWLAASLYMLCALSVIRSFLIEQRTPNRSILLLLGLYLSASLLSCFIGLWWDMTIMGMPISFRGLWICILLLAASWLLPMNQRLVSWVWMRLIAFLIFVIAWWSPDGDPMAQFLWCLLPSVIALWLYAIESKKIEINYDKHAALV